ncbi:MAG: hypothetical protein AABZ47_04585 [Planctomycetota bacterium]
MDESELPRAVGLQNPWRLGQRDRPGARRWNRRNGGLLGGVGSRRAPTPSRAYASPGFGLSAYSGRPIANETGGMAAIFPERRAFLAATASNAPVRRALNKEAGVRLPASSDDRASARLTEFEGEIPESILLGDRLQAQVGAAKARAQINAWTGFREGKYYLARRAFAAMVSADPEDLEARVGELFCVTALGSTHSATILLGILNGRSEQPFGCDIRLSERFGTTAAANEFRTRCKLLTQVQDIDMHTAAVYTLSLWYFGDRDGALFAAESIAAKQPGSVYAKWPGKMREVIGK